MRLLFESTDGIVVKLVKLYTRATYFGSTVDCKAALSSFLLEDPKNSFVPLEWQKYSNLRYDLSGFLSERVLPETVCVGLFVPEDVSIREAGVVIWFQDDFFENPSKMVAELMTKMQWKEMCVVADLFS